MAARNGQDGRVTLDRSRLKALRKQCGLSQEQVALACAEQGLYVSIASLKRAETNNNVLYRTARDLASFYQVALESLTVPTQDGAPHSDSQIQKLDDSHAAILFSARLTESGEPSLSLTQLAPINAIERQSTDNIDCIQLHGDWVQLCFGVERVSPRLLDQVAAFIHELHTCAQQEDAGITILLTECKVISHYVGQQAQHQLNTDSLALHQHLANQLPAFGTWVDASLRASAGYRYTLTPLSAMGTQAAPSHSLWHLDLSKQRRDVADFVGRRAECIQFKSLLESAEEYQAAQLIVLQGAAGIGKSRLLKEYQRLAGQANCGRVTGFHFDYEIEEAERALPSLARQLIELIELEKPDGHSSAEERQPGQTDAALGEPGILKSWLQESPTAEELLKLDNATSAQLIQYQAKTMAALICRASAKRPLLITVEDLHWADTNFIDVIKMVTQLTAEQSVIYAFSARPDTEKMLHFVQDISALPCITLNLCPLRDTEMRQLGLALGATGETHLRHCITRSEGNPLFLEHLLNEYQNHEQHLPLTIQALFLTKIQRLTSLDQMAAGAAAIIGRNFDLATLRKIIGAPEYDATSLCRARLVTRQQDSFEFCHALIYECIYNSIQTHSRRALHLQCAQQYKTSDATLYAYHLIKAAHSDAAAATREAAEILLARHQFERALSLIQEALALPALGPAASCLLRLQGTLYTRIGDNQAAIEKLQQALDLAETDTQVIEAHIQRADCMNTLDDFDAAIAHLDRAEALAENIQSNQHLARINYLRGNFYFPKGDSARCEQFHQRALDFARRCEDPELQARALGGLGDSAYADGKMYTAFEAISQCLTLCDKHRLTHVKAANLFMLATTQIYQTRTQDALFNAHESAALAHKVGHQRAEIVSRLTAAWILIDQLELVSAQAQIDGALKLASEVGAKRFEPFLMESAARTALYQGDGTGAKIVIAKAVETMETLSLQRFIGPWLYGTQALIEAHGGAADSNKLAVRSRLNQGQALLVQGCVGHNYFRFYWAAIESMLLLGDGKSALYYCRALGEYTAEEATPWTEYFLDRATLLAALLEAKPSTRPAAQAQLLYRRGKEAGLLTSLPLLEQHLPSLAEPSQPGK
ncbi:helix-turn-helix domain-containing protein [Simiduia aestuariiviva]|uniref:Putative ATPase/transcriptional regulator with XRE-family HTH domain n=1 Tax=Simiduia aestuariiviva TaxID=1510459 RepID=A0A839UVP5_9GAMM|nr:helix-turn-helix domain-containing protein [Simiduia aestuariiviva]MBB3169528.1 putative ATPase/transcriptional regulator with XRE-family HTH domain [Simiduia aestuariiviva]